MLIAKVEPRLVTRRRVEDTNNQKQAQRRCMHSLIVSALRAFVNLSIESDLTLHHLQ